MATQVQWRGGSTSEHSTFTGAAREVTVDTQKKTLVVHDGSTAGGEPLLREDGSNSALNLGTDATPALKFAGDPDTGIYSPGADQVAISTNGEGRLFVDANGNVGVNVESPAGKLGVDGALVIGNQLSTGTTTGTLRVVQSTSSIYLQTGINTTTGSSADLVFSNINASNEWMRLTSTGELKHIGGGSEGSPGVYFAGSAPSNSLYVQATTGRVGLGTSSPGSIFEAKGNSPQLIVNSTTASYPGLVFQTNGVSDGGILYNGSGDKLEFYTGDTSGNPEVVIDSSGRVGIGTSSPVQPLHLDSSSVDVRIALTNSATGSTNSDGCQIQYNTNDLYINNQEAGFIRFRTSNTNAVDIDSSGRLLVGTSSQSGIDLFTVEGHATDGTSAAFMMLRRGATNPSGGLGYLRFADANNSIGAQIDAQTDGTWASDDYPTRLVFSTNGGSPATGPTERFSIAANGNLIAGYIPSGAGTVFLKWNGGTGLITYDSSSRLIKENISDCEYGLAEILQLQPRRYFRKDDQREEVGFIADEVAAIMPEFAPLGEKKSITGDETDTDVIPVSVNYDKLTAVLTKALQEAVAEIDSLKARVAALEAS